MSRDDQKKRIMRASNVFIAVVGLLFLAISIILITMIVYTISTVSTTGTTTTTTASSTSKIATTTASISTASTGKSTSKTTSNSASANTSSSLVASADATFVKADDDKSFYANIGTNRLRLKCNVDLTHPEAEIGHTKLASLIHGITRNADSYFRMLERAWNKTCLCWAPHFPTTGETKDPKQNVWTRHGWVKGDASEGGSGMTSFEFMDVINRTILKKFPGINTAALMGHSGGGQSLSRYTGVSVLPEEMPGVTFHYVIIAPSTYLWLVPDRNWFLGLGKLNTYASKVGADKIKQNYLARNVVVLCATGDTGSDQLDMSSGAMQQGANRYERAINFVAHLKKLGHTRLKYEWYPGNHGPNLTCKTLTEILS
jgi:hypothetical protein